MQLEYVDLLFCHRPDPSVHIEETVRAMNDLMQRGLIFYWGTSEWSATQLHTAIAAAESLGLEPPVFEQCEYSLIKRNKVLSVDRNAHLAYLWNYGSSVCVSECFGFASKLRKLV